MKKLKNLFKSVEDRNEVILSGIAGSFFMPSAHTSNLIIIIGLFLCLGNSFKSFHKRKLDNLSLINLWGLGVYFILLLVSILRSENVEVGFKLLSERYVLLFVFPLLLYFISINSYDRILKVFIWSFTLWGGIGMLCLPFQTYLSLEDPVLKAALFRNEISDILDQQHLYIALLAGLSLILSLNWIRKPWSIFTIFVTILVLVVVASKIVLVGVVISLICFVLFTHRSYKLTLVTCFGSIACLILIFILFPSLLSRFREILNPQSWQLPTYGFYGSVNIRIAVWTCLIDVWKEAPILGVGEGDLQNYLNECYNNLTTFMHGKSYNTHNQYLQILGANGILGLLVFLLLFGSFLVTSIQKKQYLYTSFIVFFFVTFMVENIFSRHLGIVTFSFFNALFLFNFSEK